MNQVLCTIYTVKRSDGMFLTSGSYFGSQDIKRAKTYTKAGPAKARATYFNNIYQRSVSKRHMHCEVYELIITDARPLAPVNKKKTANLKAPDLVKQEIQQLEQQQAAYMQFLDNNQKRLDELKRKDMS